MEQNAPILTQSLLAAMEALRTAYRDVGFNLSRSLDAEAPDLVAAIEYVLSEADAVHVSAPELQPGDLHPEDLADVNLFVDQDFDITAPRRLKDVWEGRGDYDDAFAPVSPNEHGTNFSAVHHDEDLLARRMRADSDANLKRD